MAPYACHECGYHSVKWLGRCPGCAAWDTLARESPAASESGGAKPAPFLPYPEVDTDVAGLVPTGMAELDRVIGGGLVPGAVILIAGEPGIGKSTLLLQAASGMADRGQTVLYVSGEESAGQLRSRGDRLGVRSEKLLVSTEADVDAVLAGARGTRPQLIAVDSVQAMRCRDVPSIPGSVAQVRESSTRFVVFAKAESIPVMLIGHVTKEGSIAGPRALEHVVDTVIHFEGDRHHEHRILRVLKNRFGPSDEVGVFRMTESGLEGVTNPSDFFLAGRPRGAAGDNRHTAGSDSPSEHCGNVDDNWSRPVGVVSCRWCRH